MENLNEEFATPLNTTGMGNPSDTSGDILALTVNPKKKKKKIKSLTEYLKTKLK